MPCRQWRRYDHLLRDVALTAANNGNNGLPIINSTITIEGNGYTIARDTSSSAFRIFYINGTGNLTLNNVSVTGGRIDGFGGGGGFIVEAGGVLQTNNTTIYANHAGVAGGIDNQGTITMTNSTVSGNYTTAFGAGGFGNGGTVALFNTTVTGNSAANLGGGFDNSGTVILNRSIVAGNNAGTGADMFNRNIVIADNYNLLGSSFSVPVTSTDIAQSVSIASILNPVLGDNGGPARTHALVAGSPAIDAATDSGLATDQRGVARPQGAADDIGAFEGPTLIALVLDAGTLTPSFDAIVISYTATVANAISSVSVTPTVSEINASTIITVTPAGGTPVTCTGTPFACPLAVGDNVVEIHVTSPDGTIVKTYTTTVTRAPSADAMLSGLGIGTSTLTPSFDPQVTSYTASVGNATGSVSVTVATNEGNANTVVTVTPPGGTPITCMGNPVACPLAVGDNVIEVVVTAQDGMTTKTYTTIVTRARAIGGCDAEWVDG